VVGNVIELFLRDPVELVDDDQDVVVAAIVVKELSRGLQDLVVYQIIDTGQPIFE